MSDSENNGSVGMVIVAAGEGMRFGSPKQYAELCGLPLFMHSVITCAHIPEVSTIVLVVRPGDEARVEAIVSASNLGVEIEIVPGGRTRQESSYFGVKRLMEMGLEFALVHDAARALVTKELIVKTIEAVKQHGAAIAALPVIDTLKRVQNGVTESTISRINLWRAQTPQGASVAAMMQAFDHASEEEYNSTDEAELLERDGVGCTIVLGQERNAKITEPKDLEWAAQVIEFEAEA